MLRQQTSRQDRAPTSSRLTLRCVVEVTVRREIHTTHGEWSRLPARSSQTLRESSRGLRAPIEFHTHNSLSYTHLPRIPTGEPKRALINNEPNYSQHKQDPVGNYFSYLMKEEYHNRMRKALMADSSKNLHQLFSPPQDLFIHFEIVHSRDSRLANPRPTRNGLYNIRYLTNAILVGSSFLFYRFSCATSFAFL